ncbi:hypothetical protein Q2941_04815 [Bradyrhizobium sp. UFLA05-153]
MVKKLNAETAAKQVSDALQPATDFRIPSGQPNDPGQAPPTPKPMPTPLEKALGINQARKQP